VEAVTPKVVSWRRDIHQHPELGNREFRTAKLVAAHLRELGLEVREGVAHTGVVGVLRGGLPGAVVALRDCFKSPPVDWTLWTKIPIFVPLSVLKHELRKVRPQVGDF
jgi:hypothetical protein